ncbi:putative septation protein SUN4 precursor [Triangularia verruculosa]|uniref:Septation protein SUN4 n=1 Tax=Triangularia verruculosa TaxID=2587418 RepID=A0AAN6XHE1_9PEZI|nr:putative septation protein SUN4 precursor [Triangularia verruculosa]
MKGIFKTAVAAAVVVGVVAQPHNHGHAHLHRHARKHNQSPVNLEKRTGNNVIVTEVVEGPTVIKYVGPNGETIPEEKAKEGIDAGQFVVVGSSKPSFSAPPPSVTTSVALPEHGGQFFEKTTSTTPEPTTTSSEPPKVKATQEPEPEKEEEEEEPKGTGLDAEFPSGKIKCGDVPTDYGAVKIPWSTTNGWTTLASFGEWIKGKSVNNIDQPVDGTCKPKMMCSYACPPGYQKTQWPEEQGATGQSVGGLWCNADGFLELTRPSVKTLCEPGAGGVFVRNELDDNAAVCRTDYPGNENMIIPVDTQPGQTYPLTNPDSKTYYMWQGKPTTAQYYVNNAGVPVQEACKWKSDKYPDSAGNWSPTNIGVGKSLTGETFLSVFPNLPTSHAVLNFDIRVEGDISGICWLKAGTYSAKNGCTVGLKPGGTAIIVFKKPGSF